MSSYATPEGTARYAARFPGHIANSFFRTARGLGVSSLGIGSYLGNPDEATDAGYVAAVTAALRGGINFVDTSLNYRHQRSERNIGQALRELLRAGELARDEFVVCTKAGYLVPDAVPATLLRPGDVAGNMHCMAPAFLADQMERSRANLGLDAIDVFYLHNPETQLSHVPPDEFYDRLRAAFETLEALVAKGRISYYGAATWSGFRTRPAEAGGLSLARLAQIAAEIGGPDHHFRFIQMPFNLAMPEALSLEREAVDGANLSTLVAADRLGITAVASASLLQARLSSGLPDEVGRLIPEMETDAQRAIQFARSAPGVTVALVGMSNSAHVAENLRVATHPPGDLSRWFRPRQ